MIGALSTAATPAPPLAALLGDGAPADGAPADSTQAEAFAAMLAQLGLSPDPTGGKPAAISGSASKQARDGSVPSASVGPSGDEAVAIDEPPAEQDGTEDIPKDADNTDPFQSPDALLKALGAGIGAVLALVTSDRPTPPPPAVDTAPTKDASQPAAILAGSGQTPIVRQPGEISATRDAGTGQSAGENIDQTDSKPGASQPKDIARLLQMLVDTQKSARVKGVADAPPPIALTPQVAQPQGKETPSPAAVSQSADDTSGAATAPAPISNATIAMSPAAPPITPSIAGPTSIPAVDSAQQSMQHHLDLAHDGVWLDSLARDISLAAGNTSQLRFQLNPEHLGSLHVELSNGSDGTAIRMIADTDAARAILLDAQPRLIAEARAQGLRISESQVDLGNQQQPGQNQSGQSSLNNAPGQQSQTAWNGGLAGQGQNSRPHGEDRKPFAAMQQSRNERDAEPAPSSDERYA